MKLKMNAAVLALTLALGPLAHASNSCAEIDIQVAPQKTASEYLENLIQQFKIDHQIDKKIHPRSKVQDNPDAVGLIEKGLEVDFAPYKASKKMLQMITANNNNVTPSSFSRLLNLAVQSYRNTPKQNPKLANNLTYEFAVLGSFQNLREVAWLIEQRIARDQAQQQKSQQQDSSQDNKDGKASSGQKNESDSDSLQNQSGGQGQGHSKSKDNFQDDFMKLPKNYDSPLGALAQYQLIRSLRRFIDVGPVSSIKTFFESNFVFDNAKWYMTKARFALDSILEPFFRDNDKSIKELLVEAKNSIYRDPTIAFAKLKLIQRLYLEIQKNQKLSENELQFINEIDQILIELSKMRHPNSGQHDLVERMIGNLPGQIIKSKILERFKQADQIGSLDQRTLFDEVRDGKWAGAFQASLVNKRFNFFLNAEKIYSERRVQTLMRSYLREKKSEGVVVARVQDIANFQSWILDPEYSENVAMTMLSRLLKDEQYMMANRQMISMPGRSTPLERKHTNIFFDISGSMVGSKARLQGSAIAAIVDRSLSEKDKFGKPLHTVILFPFGLKVHEGIVIENAEQASIIIDQFLNTPTQANDGTAFQPCFDKHFEIIHKYASVDYTKGGTASKLNLKKANMILVTDGQSSLDKEKILKDLKNLPEGVQTFFNLLTLGSDGNVNDELNSIVNATNTQHVKSMVTNLTYSEVDQFVSEASNPQIDPDAFYYDKSQGDLTNEIISQVLNLSLPQSVDQDIVQMASMLSHQIKGQENIEVTKQAMILSELISLTDYFKKGDLESRDKQWILATLLQAYPRWAGHSLGSLSLLEERILQNIIQAANAW